MRNSNRKSLNYSGNSSLAHNNVICFKPYKPTYSLTNSCTIILSKLYIIFHIYYCHEEFERKLGIRALPLFNGKFLTILNLYCLMFSDLDNRVFQYQYGLREKDPPPLPFLSFYQLVRSNGLHPWNSVTCLYHSIRIYGCIKLLFTPNGHLIFLAHMRVTRSASYIWIKTWNVG